MPPTSGSSVWIPMSGPPRNCAMRSGECWPLGRRPMPIMCPGRITFSGAGSNIVAGFPITASRSYSARADSAIGRNWSTKVSMWMDGLGISPPRALQYPFRNIDHYLAWARALFRPHGATYDRTGAVVLMASVGVASCIYLWKRCMSDARLSGRRAGTHFVRTVCVLHVHQVCAVLGAPTPEPQRVAVTAWRSSAR